MMAAAMLARSLSALVLVLVLGAVWLWSERGPAGEPAAPRAPSVGADPRAVSPLTPSLAAVPAPTAKPAAAAVSAEERRGVAPEPPAASAYRVRVQEEDGRPLADAAVVLCPSGWSGGPFEQAPGEERRTDANGVAAFDAPDAELDELLVLAADHAPVVALRTAPDEQLVVVPGAIALAGTALIDGVPTPGLSLDVRGFRDPSVGWSPAVQDALRQRELGQSRLRCRTGADGGFALRGLPAGETVEIRAPDAFALRSPTGGDARGVTARTIDTDVLLDLVRKPTLSGRPVRAEPARSGLSDYVALVYRFERADGAVDEGWASGSVGERFSLQLPCAPRELTRASVQLRTEWLGGELLAARSAVGPFAGSIELGDIPIGAASTPFLLRVEALGGGPVAGALALLSGRLSNRTDGRGLVTLDRGPEDTYLLVGALGYELARVDLPAALPAPPDPYTVALVPANRLRVEVLPADGRTPLRGLQLSLAIPLPMDDDTPEMHGEFASIRGAVPGAGIWSDGERTHVYDLGEDGVLELTDLPVELELGLTVHDRYEHTLAEAVVVLLRGEHRTLPLRLLELPRTVEGRVVDERGAPLPQAIAILGGFFEEARADAEGRFRLKNVYAARPELTLTAEGHVTLEVQGWDALARSPFVLHPARTVWIEVLAADGERRSASVSLQVDGEAARGGTRRSEGFYQFDGVPLRPALVRAEAAGRTVEVPLDASSTEATVRF